MRCGRTHQPIELFALTLWAGGFFAHADKKFKGVAALTAFVFVQWHMSKAREVGIVSPGVDPSDRLAFAYFPLNRSSVQRISCPFASIRNCERPMQPTLSADQVREFDRLAAEQYHLPGRVLMENAGAGVADALKTILDSGPVAILCGKGNNGGDGFVIARHLDAAGFETRVLTTAADADYQGDAAANLRTLRAARIPIRTVQPSNVDCKEIDAFCSGAVCVVDALLGIGITGSPRSPMTELIRYANELKGALRVAVDIPSGMNAETGELGEPTFRAERTYTMAAAKPGLLVAEAASHVGELEVIDLGVPSQLLRQFGLQSESGSS